MIFVLSIYANDLIALNVIRLIYNRTCDAKIIWMHGNKVWWLFMAKDFIDLSMSVCLEMWGFSMIYE